MNQYFLKILLAVFFGLAFSTIACSNSSEAQNNNIDTGITEDLNKPAIGSINAESGESSNEGRHTNPADKNIPDGARALIDAYPKFIKGYENGQILFTDGTAMIYDDGKKKDFPTMLDNSDLEDMFYTRYVQPSKGESPEYLADAGRSRNEALFKKMYGNSATAVRKNLVKVPWFGQTVEFTSVNGAADQLQKVAAELQQHPELKKYLKSSGTFYWRTVRGAKRQSAHSYGIAFDIGVDHSDYWLWKNSGAKETSKIKYANRIPTQIADIFRKYGFIWGGSWYHFDTMHFEYRPEILRYAELTETVN